MILQERNIVVCILLSIITCGIYAIYWQYRMLYDLYAYTGQPSSAGVDILLGFFTLWIIPAYKIAKLQMEAQLKTGLFMEDNTVIYIILCCFGLAIVVDAIAQSSINRIIEKGGGRY